MVIEYAGKYRNHTSLWLCRCDCGVEKTILGSNLTAKTHGTKSCGCAHNKKRLDISGQQYNYWTVIKMLNVRGGKSWCLCKCECGREKEVVARNIVSGTSKSCGCKGIKQLIIRNKEERKNKLPINEAIINQIIAGYKIDARNRNYEWALSRNECKILFQQSCYYCGSLPSNRRNHYGRRTDKGSYVFSGIDRVDNLKGYIVDNVVPCCRKCNRAKDTMTQEEFIGLCREIVIKNRRLA